LPRNFRRERLPKPASVTILFADTNEFFIQASNIGLYCVYKGVNWVQPIHAYVQPYNRRQKAEHNLIQLVQDFKPLNPSRQVIMDRVFFQIKLRNSSNLIPKAVMYPKTCPVDVLDGNFLS
jgi:hypothetical protein